MRFPLYLAIRNLFRHPGRNFLYILGISITAALLLDMVMLAGGIRISLGRMLRDLGYEIRISPRGTLPFETDAQIQHFSEIRSELSRDKAVRSVDALLGTTLAVQHNGESFTSFVIGLRQAKNPLYHPVEGSEPRDGKNEVLVNQYLAEARAIHAGDHLKLWMSSNLQNTGNVEPEEVTVSGIGVFELDAEGQYTISCPLSTLQGLTHQTQEDPVSVVLLKLDDPAQGDRIAESINKRYPQLSAYTIKTVVEAVDRQLSYFKQFAYILGAISLVVTFVLVFLITTISFHDRVGEIALLRALGLGRKTIFITTVLEGVLTSASSAVFGFLLGKIVALYLDSILKTAPGLPESFSFFVLEPQSVAKALTVLLLTGFFAGLYPAATAVRLPIADTLREEIL